MKGTGSYVRGAVTLLMSGVAVRLLGALFKIPLTNLIGDRGMGLFSFALQFFSLLYVVTAAGLPTAVSVLVAEALAREQRGHARRVAVCAAAVFGLWALALSVGLAVLSGPLSAALGEPEARLGLLAAAPAVFFVTLEAVLRGWYQGTGNMTPTAQSQLVEAVGKLLVGLLLARTLLARGYDLPIAAAGAVCGVTAGEILAALYLALCARRGARELSRQRAAKEPAQPVLPRLLELMIPVTLGSAVMTVAGFLDMAVLYRRLPLAGLDAGQISAQYGAYSGMVLTLFHLPQALSSAVAVSLLPALTAALARKDTRLSRRLTSSALRLTTLVCLPCGVGLSVFARPLLGLLFAAQPKGVDIAVPLLQLLGPTELPVGLAAVTAAILQALNRPDIPVYTTAVGCTLKLAVSWELIARPEVGMAGAPIGSLLCYTLVVLCNLIAIARLMHGMPPVFSTIFKAIAACAGMGVGALEIYGRLVPQVGALGALPLAIAAAVLLYVLLLRMLGALETEDIAPLPGGKRLVRLLRLRPQEG